MSDTRRCYIAASMSLRDEIRRLSLRLRQYGIDCRMRWLDHHWPHEGGLSNPANLPAARQFARVDFEDVTAAELVIGIIPPDGDNWGRLVELGVALATAQEVWIIDRPDRPKNVFTAMSGFLPEPYGLVRRFLDIDDMVRFAWMETTGYSSTEGGTRE